MKICFFYAMLLFGLILNSVFAQETILNGLMFQEQDESFRKSREEWFENLHRCEPGLPWWLLDQTARESRWAKLSDEKVLRLKQQSDVPLAEWVAENRILGTWLERGSSNQAGRVHTADIDFNDETIFLASAGGNIWKGNLQGNQWTCLNNSKRFANPRMVRIIPMGSKRRIVVVSNSPTAVYYSDNDGLSWKSAEGLSNAQKWGSAIRGMVSLNYTVYILVNEWDYSRWKSMVTLYKSVDSGVSFSPVYSTYLNPSFCDIWSPRYFVNTAYFVCKDTLYEIQNNGKLRLVSINTFIDSYTSGVTLSGSVVENITYISLLVLTTSTESIFYFSSDGGRTFRKKGKHKFYPFEKNSFAQSVLYPERLYFGQVHFYWSIDSGATWRESNKWWDYYPTPETRLHADIPGIISLAYRNKTNNNTQELLFICTDGGIYISYDGGLSVRNLSLRNLNVSQYYGVYSFQKEKQILFAGSQDQGFQRCLVDSGGILAFEQTISGDYGYLTSSDGGYHLWSVYPGFAMLYIGANNQKFKSVTWDFQGGGFLWMPPIIADPYNPKIAYVVSGRGSSSRTSPASFIYRLEYLTNVDSIVYETYPFNFAQSDPNRKISALAISPLNYNNWYALTNDGKFFASTDAGENWMIDSSFAGPSGHYFYGNKILLSKYSAGKIVVAGSGYSNPGVFISYDNGKKFVPLGKDLPNTMFYDIEYNEDESLIFAATEIGPFVYHFAENRWFDLSGIDSPDQIFWDVEYLPSSKTVRFATYGRGIWDFLIEQITSMEASNISDDKSFTISVSPNPFTNLIRIVIENVRNESTALKIYDNYGRLIKVIFQGIPNGNSMEFTWDGTSENGVKLSSGNYIVICSNGFVVRYKIINMLK
jgi:hypothetical protein